MNFKVSYRFIGLFKNVKSVKYKICVSDVRGVVSVYFTEWLLYELFYLQNFNKKDQPYFVNSKTYSRVRLSYYWELNEWKLRQIPIAD